MKAIAVDIGTGQTRVGLVSTDKAFVEYEEVYQSERGYRPDIDETYDHILELTEAVCRKASVDWSELAGIGISLPGPVSEHGMMGPSSALPSWHGRRLIEYTHSRFPAISSQHIAVLNDANAAALGESMFGAARREVQTTLVYFAVRSGVGAGIVINGSLHVGVNGNAGEWGHVVVDPQGPFCHGCGLQSGCLEAIAGGDAIAQRAISLFPEGRLIVVQEAALQRGPSDRSAASLEMSNSGGSAQFSMPDIGGGRPHVVWARDVVVAAERGDSDAQQILEDAGTALGKAIAQAFQILNPKMVVIGGIVTGNADYFNAASRWARAHSSPVHNATTIQAAALPDTNCMLGAAAAVFNTSH